MGNPRGGPGRRPHPTAILKLRGTLTRGKRRRTHEPQPLGDLSEPPLDLTDGQEEVWRYAIMHMPPGVMKKIDRDVLAMWCEARDRWNTARLMQAMLDRDAKLKLLIKTAEGLAASPYHDIIDRCAKIMFRCIDHLGFSPASRPRIHADINVSATEAPVDPWAGLRLIKGGRT